MIKSKNKKKIIITGCAGFIGSNLLDELLKKKNKIIGIDNLSTGQRKFLNKALKNKNFKFIKMDLLNLPKLKKIFRNADFVYHLAANADVRFGLNHPQKDLEQNAICTFNVLEAMRFNSIKKIVFTSTAPIYGNNKIFPTPENAPLSNQTSLYGASKLYCEGLIQSYCEGYNFKSWIYRFVSILGNRYTHGHVYDFYKQLIFKNNKKLLILGDGNQKKSYLNVKDCISAILISVKKSKNKINTFNLGCDDYINVKRSAKIISKALNLNPKFLFSGGKTGWIGDQPFVYLSTNKIKKIGWRSKISIENSIKDTVNWLNNNKWVFKKRR